jgi:hypothetical protein
MTLETVAMAAVVTLGVVVLVVSLRNELAEQREHRERMRPVLPPDRPVVSPGDPDDWDGPVPEVPYMLHGLEGSLVEEPLPGTQFVVDQEARRLIEVTKDMFVLSIDETQRHFTTEIRAVNLRFNQLNDTLRGRETLDAEVNSLRRQMQALSLDLLELRDAVRELGGERLLGQTVAPPPEGEVQSADR